MRKEECKGRCLGPRSHALSLESPLGVLVVRVDSISFMETSLSMCHQMLMALELGSVLMPNF